MPKKKVEEEIEMPEEDLNELGEFDPELETQPSEEDLLRHDIEKLKGAKLKLIEALTINQKYIKRNFENIKLIGDNQKIILERMESK